MPRQGYTKSGERKQLPTRGADQGKLGSMDKYPPTGPALKVTSQIKYCLDADEGKDSFDACYRDGGLSDYD